MMKRVVPAGHALSYNHRPSSFLRRLFLHVFITLGFANESVIYQRAIFPIVPPRSSVAVVTPRAWKTRLMVGILML